MKEIMTIKEAVEAGLFEKGDVTAVADAGQRIRTSLTVSDILTALNIKGENDEDDESGL